MATDWVIGDIGITCRVKSYSTGDIPTRLT